MDPRTSDSDPFPATRWTVVVRAREGGGETARVALGELCTMYWFPLYAFARRRGLEPGDAEDATQGLFAQLFEGGLFGRAERGAGRLRAFLLAAFKDYLVDQRRRDTAQKRGEGVVVESLDVADAESRYAAALASGDSPEALFERRWALELLERAMRRVGEGYAGRGRGEVFEALKPKLEWNAGGAGYAGLAEQLGMSEDGVAQEVRRMRRRFREALEAEVAETVERPEDVAGELRCLAMALG